MFTAIVLDKSSQIKVRAKALVLGLYNYKSITKCHHVTLALGKISGFKIGAARNLVVTHYGFTPDGKVSAFRVRGAEDSKNMFPHVTIAVAPGHKPAESNQIVEWTKIEPFEINGKIEICD